MKKMMQKLKYKTIKIALKNVAGINLTDKGCEQLLIIAKEFQKLIDIIKSGI